MKTRCVCVALPALVMASIAGAEEVLLRVTVESLTPANGAALSPFTVGFHDGTFDAFDAGGTASLGVQNIAELGDGTEYISEFMAAQPQGVSGTIIATENAFGPGIFLPGGSGSFEFTIDTAVNRFFSFGSMVVPSNDRFLGDDKAIELFDANGDFIGQTVMLVGADIWDAGTEVNAHFGAAFIEGQDAMDHAPENGVIVLDDDFGVYAGVTTAAGYPFDALPDGGAGISRISFTVVPAPGTAALLVVFTARARRRRSI